MTNDIKLIEVFAGQLWQAAVIKNILEDNGIHVHLENELIGTLEPWAVAAGGFNPVKVIVSDRDHDLSQKLIREYNNSAPPEEESD